MKPLLIRNARIIDGSGADSFHGDILIEEGRIASVGNNLAEPPGVEVVHAQGRVLCPGFIDAHCHGTPLEEPDFHNYLAMGVTAILLGQDGTSPGPAIGAWLDKVDAIRPGVNVMTLVGHGSVRHQSGIGNGSNPSSEELARMAGLVATGMDEGAFGLSSGLEYLPGLHADSDELCTIAVPVGERGGIVMSHMRSEDDDKIEGAIDELIEQGRRGNCHVHISHLKVTLGRGAERGAAIIRRIEEARVAGVRITADIYPYTASCTTVSILFPDYAKPPHSFEEVEITRRKELAKAIRDKVIFRNGPGAMLFATGRWAGRTLEQLAAEARKPFEDFLIDDIGLDGAEAAYFVMDDELQSVMMRAPGVMFSSDGSPEMGHPRGYGSFARVIRHFVRERGLFTLEEAIHKMTGLTASTLGIEGLGRGFVREGCHADLLLFDPARVVDRASYEHPHTLAEGFDMILVNGEIVQRDGKFTGARAGRAIRRCR